MLHLRNFPLQILKRVPAPFDGEGWLFEVKHDGFRVLAIRDGGLPRLYTRNGYDISRRHQHIIAALSGAIAIDSRAMSAVRRLLTPRAISPFRDEVNDPETNFCGPAFRVSVEFLDFTDDGYVRHPALQRFADELFSKI